MEGAPELQESYNQVSQVEHVAEELALESVLSEERHDEIVKETDRIWNRLEALSQENLTQNQNLQTALAAELKALAAELKALKAELTALKGSPDTRLSTPSTPSAEPKPPAPSEGDGRAAPPIVQPPEPEPAPVIKKRVKI